MGGGLLLAAVLLSGALPGARSVVDATGFDTGGATPSPTLDDRPTGSLGEAPSLPDEPVAGTRSTAAAGVRVTAAATTAIDTSSRGAVTTAYNDWYLANHGAAQGWTGSVANCTRGTVNAGYTAAINELVNYFRAMAGLPGVSMSASLNSLDQAAALIMDANDTLTHAPTSGMKCYSDDGYAGASHSNLCLGCVGPSAIDAYMYDFGSNNTAVGHRRWILFPPQTVLGTGSTTQGDALYVLHTSSWVRPADASEWISWPPKGFVPYSQVYPRFSLTRQGAGFDTATVSVRVDGAPVAASVISRNGSYGDPALVFEVNLGPLGLASGDRVFDITVNGVNVDGSAVSYSWQSTSFVPGVANPVGVAATGISDAQVRVTWRDVIGEDGYRIRRDDGSPTWPVVGTIGANGTSFTDGDGLEPETSYDYKVCAYVGTTESCSTAVTGTTLAPGVVLPQTVIVDDRNPGFRKYGTGWRGQPVGHLVRSYWTPVRATGTRQSATWTAALCAPGRYAVWVRLPVQHATTRSAVYQVTTADGTKTRTISQLARAGRWTLLGTYTFGSSARVRVTDLTGESASSGRTLAVDAIKFVPETQ
jgi:uncharacterized protein YkwD